ncbi:serine--tRNA ligase [Acholeplasma laidlawii]|jgi:seryl-tRNA synthetase|uniref:Serine--tRNA ligase n=2 Tax=Acholeplasma laidlawii TaxID=2148 RepID=SYS_ACHLI|nr:serine--tRNA ligase [Acholeplasma laidlawii]A9NE72.1 RecName: Full=Serine--tRNA ligase; AltName: Full=Seryl-tRNA synthetase; Short=SerRS; AltName: Full=Seryl-tRNA(Ser/Sec) synthetase [Acholeplasma laidlawii PG-8A]ABX80652.1 seryl-tRNA synthetase [Acholeplasma laidlawii PG-8A]NWH11013.1 serine--tRNA ligase [Acholeplasma laidlawii]NWH12399.1 serine--tRNA ligase [Acholeplasma laidlawii]NWH13785.1 serine--tRNA ligase [Acholeplasma laidlawii]NWH15251.1 serine--tRNA ligase [Acholeplasma laidlawi
MLDLKYITENIDEVILKLNTRGGDFSHLRQLIDLQEERKSVIKEVEDLKAKRNEYSKEIGELKRQKQDASHVLLKVESIKSDIPALELKLGEIDEKINKELIVLPNIPADDVPVGKDESANIEIKKWGTIRHFDFEVKDHTQLGEALNILDFERATKITGPRFVVDKGLGARLERALINFMIDTHAYTHGYTEIIPPFIVNDKSMYATGQFPKFKEDAFKLEGFDWYLNPTAEVPTINLFRDEIIDNDALPIQYVAYTTAFRSEAGSAGRDTKGILRQHQFNKVELIKFARPEDSEQAHQDMLANSERILQLLNIPYRVVVLSTGDMGFGMSKTYDIEVWLPGQNMYREIGSISNARDFQARRANIRFKRSKDAKTEYVHTLNGSGLAVGRTMIAVLENYQNQDGSITIPEVLKPYMGVEVIK